jgi:hypothetical protein
MMDAAESLDWPLIIIVSDESPVCLDGDRRWVRFRRGQWNQTALRLMAKFPKGVMVLGCHYSGMQMPADSVLCMRGSGEYLRILGESKVVAQCTSRTVIDGGCSNRARFQHIELG